MPRQRAGVSISTALPGSGGISLFDSADTANAQVRLLQQWIGIPKLLEIYEEAERMRQHRCSDAIFQPMLDLLNISWECPEPDLRRVPLSGPTIVVANHPFGMVEGLFLTALLRKVRADVRVMANSLLAQFPKVAEHLILVNPFGGEEAHTFNRQGLREAIHWLKGGGLLLVFPAGEVSSFDLRRRAIADPVWSETVARLAMVSGAPVLPMFVDGQNGVGFQLAGMLHPRLRTALLVREFLNKAGKTFRVRTGRIVSAKKLAEFSSDRERIEFLRRKTYLLASRASESSRSLPEAAVPQLLLRTAGKNSESIVEPTDTALMVTEIESLGQESLLAQQGEFFVYIAEANRIPHVVRELGRLRETTFRQMGEGTGKAIDLDEFDSYYLHLFIWHQADKEIVGAYRLGRTDLIIRNLGLRGLYTHKLFAYRREFLDRISPALEMGRSFVCYKHQRTYAPLLLLWRGIGAFVCRNPQYRTLFGPVSISNEYQPSSRQLMVKFLKEYCRAAHLAKLVRARNPFRIKPVQGWNAGGTSIAWDIEELGAFIADNETDQKGIPVLLKQYLKLGGKLVAFNVDANFSNALDGLIVVDLLQSDPTLLERYMGKPGLQAFGSYHSRQAAQVR